MVHAVTACIVMAHVSYGLYSNGLYSYGLCTYGLHSYGLCSYCLYGYGFCSYDLFVGGGLIEPHLLELDRTGAALVVRVL